MPLTFAHPAIALPFSRDSRYINFLALVLGSMAPDFEYFIKGRPSAEIGHTYLGFFTFNLPIVIIVYLIYKTFIHNTLFNHLPFFLQDYSSQKTDSFSLVKIIVFLYSAIFGMFTHVAWDSFTHVGGFMVRNFSFFTYTLTIFGFNLPIYKIFQHGSTVVGILAIVGYMYYRAKKNTLYRSSPITNNQKWPYWIQIAVVSILLFILWALLDNVSIHAYGILVVRIIDCVLLSLLAVSLYVTYVKKTHQA